MSPTPPTLAHQLPYPRGGGEGGGILKEHLEHLNFLHNWTYNTRNKLYNGNYNKYLKKIA